MVLPEFIDHRAVEAAHADVSRLVDEIASTLVVAKKISSTFADLDWKTRLLKIAEEWPDAPLMLITKGVLPKAFQALYEHPRILEALEDLGLDGDVAAHPAWNLRCKMPSHPDTVVPWHQVCFFSIVVTAM